MHSETSLEPVAFISACVEEEVWDVECLVIQDLDGIRPQLLQVGLVDLREPLQEVLSGNLGVKWDEDVGKVDCESWTPD